MQITSQQQYRQALAELSKVEDAKEGSPEFERKMELTAATEAWEQSFQADPDCAPGRPGSQGRP